MSTFTRIPPCTNWGCGKAFIIIIIVIIRSTDCGARAPGKLGLCCFFCIADCHVSLLCVCTPTSWAVVLIHEDTSERGGRGAVLYNIKAAGDLRGLGRPLLRGGRLPSHPVSGPCTGLLDCRQIARLERGVRVCDSKCRLSWCACR